MCVIYSFCVIFAPVVSGQQKNGPPAEADSIFSQRSRKCTAVVSYLQDF